MTLNRVQQQMYTRERAGIFQSTAGYDTIATSEGLEENYVKGYLHPLCIYTSPKSLIERGEKDADHYPEAFSFIQPGETGDLIIGQAVFVTADFTGQRSTYFMHNYVIPKAMKDEWVKQPEKLFQLKDFQTSYDSEIGQVLPEADDLAYEAATIVEEEFLENLGMTETLFKQLLFAVMSSISGKKKVFISLDVPLQDYSKYAKQLLELIFSYLPYAFRRNLGALTFSSEPEGKKYIHVIFFEPGTLNYRDPAIEKQFIFDFSKGTISGVDLEGQQPEYLDYALLHFSESQKMDEFFAFAEMALSGLDALELASYPELTVIYQTLTEGDTSFYDKNKPGFLHRLLKYLTVKSEAKMDLVYLFVDLLEEEYHAADELSAIDYIKAVLEFNQIALCSESLTFILKTIDYYKNDALFLELWKVVEQDKRSYHALLQFIENDGEDGDLLEGYLYDRFQQVTQVDEILSELHFMLQSPYLLKNEKFIAIVCEKIGAAVKNSADPIKAALAVKDLTIEQHHLEFRAFKDILVDQTKKALLKKIDLSLLTLRDMEAYGEIFTWKLHERQLITGDEKEKYSMLLALYELIDAPPQSSALHLNTLSLDNREKVRGILKRILQKNMNTSYFQLLIIAFEDDRGSHNFDELFKYLSETADDDTILSFIKWSETNSKIKVYYQDALRRYLIRNTRSIWKNKATRTELKKIDSKGLKKILKEVQNNTPHPVVKFLKGK